MLTDYIYVFIFMCGGIFLVGSALTLARLLRPSNPSKEKQSTYECGEKTIGEAWTQYNVKYYLYALLFVIFDVEAVFLIPWAVSYKDMGMSTFYSFVEMMIFLLILAVALVYAWKKGVMKWQ